MAKCFSPLSFYGRVVLLASYTGANQGDNLAQTIADIAKRNVIAPTEEVKSEKLGISQHLTIFHSSRDGFLKNIFKLFQPTYKKCQEVIAERLHTREMEAMTSIAKDLQKKALLPESIGFEETKEFLRLCKDDPREKILFLVASHDENGGLNPYNYMQLNGALASYYDFKYKVVANVEEICQEIKDAAAMGNLKHVILNAHGKPVGICLSGDCRYMHQWMHKDQQKDWKKCFEGINPTGKMVMLGCKTGNSEEDAAKETIAGLIAEVAKRTIVAPTEVVYPEYLELVNTENMEIYHPSETDSFSYYWKLITFQKPDNIFKNFNP